MFLDLEFLQNKGEEETSAAFSSISSFGFDLKESGKCNKKVVRKKSQKRGKEEGRLRDFLQIWKIPDFP